MNIKIKSFVLIPIDIALIIICFFTAAFIRAFDLLAEMRSIAQAPSDVYKVLLSPAFIVIICIYIVVFILFNLYSTLLKHITLEDAFRIVAANLVAAITTALYNFFLARYLIPNDIGLSRIPTGIVMIAAMFITLATIIVRSLPRAAESVRSSYLNKHSKKAVSRVLVYGAGEAGVALLRDIQRNPGQGYKIVGFYDDNEAKVGSTVHGIRIYGPHNGVDKTVETLHVDTIIIAAPSATAEQFAGMIDRCKSTGCKVRRLPSLYDMVIDGELKLTAVRDVDINDILGREETQLDVDSISGYIKDSVVLVTGAGGSIGSELCRQIIKYHPKKLILFDIYENNVYDLENELFRLYGKYIPLKTYIGSVRDYKRMTDVFDAEQPEVVFHAAAHKHVPLMEFSPGEAVKNNIFGTYNSARVAHEHKVKSFVLISTDKAVNPTNIMGATKRVAEIVIQAFSKISDTRFVAVRFGNVLGSNGSVVPLFKKQIADGGPVTVTHPEITRFFMTIPEAARLVVQAGAMAQGGEIFILDMGNPVKIADLARDLIRLSGFIPDVDIKIEYTGLRPGEKLYEELLRAEEGVENSSHNGIFIAKPFYMEWDDVQTMLSEFDACINLDHDAVAGCIKKYVPTYHNESGSSK